LWTARAERDCKDIEADLAKLDPRAAIDTVERIIRELWRLAEPPYPGRRGRCPGTREHVIADIAFIVVYQVRQTEVVIMRVLSGTQQWPEG
jgi:plasmid stabilization system protein ParE